MSGFFMRPRRRTAPTTPLRTPIVHAVPEESPFADGGWHCPAPRPRPGRMMPHPGPLGVDGTLLTCATCAAGQDWLLLCRDDRVNVRCRCGYEWAEPALDSAWFDDHCGPATGPCAPRETGIRAFGFDGILAGAYLP